MACVPTVAISSVWPSGADLATALAPIEPPAPPRLSTTRVALSASPSAWATGRATISVGPPAGKGTIKRICVPARLSGAAIPVRGNKLAPTAVPAAFRKSRRSIRVSSGGPAVFATASTGPNVIEILVLRKDICAGKTGSVPVKPCENACPAFVRRESSRIWLRALESTPQ